MIRFVTAPEEIKVKQPIKLFLGGGITSCPDWQSEIIEKLIEDSESKNHDYLCDVIVYNPRRPYFPMNIKEEAERQITWEYHKLKESDIIAFWFSNGSLNPIVLYELGRWGTSDNKPIVIGMDDDYQRREDVEIQTRLSRPDIKIAYDLKNFYYNLLTEIKKFNKK